MRKTNLQNNPACFPCPGKFTTIEHRYDWESIVPNIIISALEKAFKNPHIQMIERQVEREMQMTENLIKAAKRGW